MTVWNWRNFNFINAYKTIIQKIQLLLFKRKLTVHFVTLTELVGHNKCGLRISVYIKLKLVFIITSLYFYPAWMLFSNYLLWRRNFIKYIYRKKGIVLSIYTSLCNIIEFKRFFSKKTMQYNSE